MIHKRHKVAHSIDGNKLYWILTWTNSAPHHHITTTAIKDDVRWLMVESVHIKIMRITWEKSTVTSMLAPETMKRPLIERLWEWGERSIWQFPSHANIHNINWNLFGLRVSASDSPGAIGFCTTLEVDSKGSSQIHSLSSLLFLSKHTFLHCYSQAHITDSLII